MTLAVHSGRRSDTNVKTDAATSGGKRDAFGGSQNDESAANAALLPVASLTPIDTETPCHESKTSLTFDSACK